MTRSVCEWNAEPGSYTLCVRATDAQGHVELVEQPWHVEGMANDMLQRVEAVAA